MSGGSADGAWGQRATDDKRVHATLGIIGGLTVLGLIHVVVLDRVATALVLVLAATLLAVDLWMRRRYPASSARLGSHIYRRPPGRPFHLVIAVPAVTLLGSHSVPGVALPWWIASAALLGIGAVVWFGRALTYAIAKLRRRAEGPAIWFLVAPLGGMLTLALLSVEAPLRVRWALSRDAFDDVVEQRAEDADRFDFPGQLGLYEITSVWSVGDAVIFKEDNGAFIDDAGFAYLPDGPFTELETGSFESPQFRHIGGNWYAWMASW